MQMVFIVIAVLVVAALVYLALRPRKQTPAASAPRPPAPQPRPAKASTIGPAPAAPATPPAPAPAPAPDDHPMTMPASLAELTEISRIQLLRADQLPTLRHQALLEQLRKIPQPSRVLQQMVSPTFLARASSSELSDIVLGEPVVAARVVAAVNSPLYGLQKPVSSIGQAVTFLGLNSVRNICVRYLLDASFQAAEPTLRRHFDILWRSSGVAGELCLALAQKLQWPDSGTLATHVVLSFLGQFASASLMRNQGLPMGMGGEMAARTLAEQEHLGLSAAEMGFLLMREWELPGSILEEVRAIDRILVTQASELDAQQGARLALCYLCARLGERIVQGQITNLAEFDLLADGSPDFHCLRSHLAQPALQRLPEHLRSPDVARVLERLASASVATK